MQQVVLIGHTLIAILIIVLVLLQRGKGADAGAGFGAGASGTVFGARGSSSFFSRATAILATAFFASSLTLAYLSSQRTTGPTSLLDDAPVVEQEAEAVPLDEGEVEVPLPGSIEAPAEEDVDALPSLEEEAPAEDVPAEEDASTE
jgi:preprotein translocase subunit SecG